MSCAYSGEELLNKICSNNRIKKSWYRYNKEMKRLKFGVDPHNSERFTLTKVIHNCLKEFRSKSYNIELDEWYRKMINELCTDEFVYNINRNTYLRNYIQKADILLLLRRFNSGSFNIPVYSILSALNKLYTLYRSGDIVRVKNMQSTQYRQNYLKQKTIETESKAFIV